MFVRFFLFVEKYCDHETKDSRKTSSVVAFASRMHQVHEEGNREGKGRAKNRRKEIAGSAFAKSGFYSWLLGLD